MGLVQAEGSGTSNSAKIIANIFISFIGAGVLGLPFAFKKAGVAEGCLIMGFICFFSLKAMLLLLDCKNTIVSRLHLNEETNDLLNASTNEVDEKVSFDNNNDHAEKTPSKHHNLTYDELGFCCAYLIFIAENLQTYLPYVNRQLWLIVLLPPLYMLTLYRELHSMFAQFSNLFAFVVVFWFDFEHIYLAKRIHPKEFSAKGFPFFFAVAVYCFEGAGMVLALESSVSPNVRHKFRKYLISTLCLLVVLYVAFGICGYMSFGPSTNAIITLNLPKGTGVDFAMLVKFSLCFSLFFTYPVSQLMDKQLPVQSSRSRRVQENALRLVLVATTGFIVLIVPNFADLMALVGATCCTLIAFILPGYFHLKLHRGSLTRGAVAFDVSLIVLGIVSSIIGTMDTLNNLTKSHVRMTPKNQENSMPKPHAPEGSFLDLIMKNDSSSKVDGFLTSSPFAQTALGNLTNL